MPIKHVVKLKLKTKKQTTLKLKTKKKTILKLKTKKKFHQEQSTSPVPVHSKKTKPNQKQRVFKIMKPIVQPEAGLDATGPLV